MVIFRNFEKSAYVPSKKYLRVSMTTQNGARRSCTWARRIISDYIFRVAILSNITLHYPFLRIIIWTTRLLYCPQLCPLSMTDDSIWTLHLFDRESPKRLQLKEAAYHA